MWHFYRALLHLRKTYKALACGKYENVENDNSYVFSFSRIKDGDIAVVIINLSGDDQPVKINLSLIEKSTSVISVFGIPALKPDEGGIILGTLSPYAVEVLEINNSG